MNTTLETSLSVVQILTRRLEIMSREDVESRKRTARAIAEARAVIRDLERLTFDA